MGLIFAECTVRHGNHPKDTLRDWADENRTRQEDEDDDELTNPDIHDMGEVDWQIWARDHPQANLPIYDLDTVGNRPLDDAWDIDPARTQWPDVGKMNSWLSGKMQEEGQVDQIADPVDIETLNPRQLDVFTHYVNTYRRFLLGQPLQQHFINIDGTAGCRKTYLIRKICQELRRLADEHAAPDPIRVLAPSGVAALNIHGRTVHSSLALPINETACIVGQ
jgi:PIF1-like helicase